MESTPKFSSKEIALMLSGGKFAEAESQIAENAEWFIYEHQQHMIGKIKIMEFCNQVANYFKSVTTDFKEFGFLEDGNRITIYGHATFLKQGIITDEVDSCDVYEFDAKSMVNVIRSYCNSKKIES